MSLMDSAKRKMRTLKRIYSRLTDPVPQDWGAVLYGDYQGEKVILVPVMDPRNKSRIADWIPSPSVVARINDRMRAEREAEQSASFEQIRVRKLAERMASQEASAAVPQIQDAPPDIDLRAMGL